LRRLVQAVFWAGLLSIGNPHEDGDVQVACAEVILGVQQIASATSAVQALIFKLTDQIRSDSGCGFEAEQV
jgi:hypothetical protein